MSEEISREEFERMVKIYSTKICSEIKRLVKIYSTEICSESLEGVESWVRIAMSEMKNTEINQNKEDE